MKTKLIVFLMTVFASSVLVGCAARVVVIPADKTVHYLPAGQNYVAPNGGMWLVPDARMQEILRKLNRP